MRYFVFSCCIFITTVHSFGQGADTLHQKLLSETLFKGSHFSFSITPYISQKAKITKESGEYFPGATNMHGLEVGANYHIHLKKDYSLIIGLHGGASARNYKLFISKNEFTPPLKRDVNEERGFTRIYDFYLSAPVWLEKRWASKNNNHWNLLAGINLRYYPSDVDKSTQVYYEDINSQPVLVYEQDVVISNNFRPWVNFNVGGGYAFLLKNNNFLQLNLLTNFSFTKLVNGGYTVFVTGKNPSIGKYSANLSYAGLSVSYVFTGTNKRLLKIYERKLNNQ